MKLFRRRVYGLAPEVERSSRPMSSEMMRFMDFVMNVGLGILSAWSLLFYLSVCLPWANKLRLATSISFLAIPLLFFALKTFHYQVETGLWKEAQLGRLGWVMIQWVKEFMGLIANMLILSSLAYLIVRLLMFVFPRIANWFAWVTARVDAFLGVSLSAVSGADLTGCLGGWLYTIVAGFYLTCFLYLWSSLMNLARIFAMADIHFIYEKVLSPALYGWLSRFLWGSLTLAVLLSFAGAVCKALAGIGSILGWSLPNPELDLLPEALSRTGQGMGKSLPTWLPALHLPLALTIARVLFLRVTYVKSILSAMWSGDFTLIGSVVLALPLFFRPALYNLPVGRFYDGYLLAAQWIYAVTYLAFLLPMFVLMLRDRFQSEAAR